MTSEMLDSCRHVGKFRTFGAFQKSGTFCDVTVIVGERSFFCHRIILAADSPYFLAMFDGKMKESQQDKVTVRIEGVSSEAQGDTFQKVVDCIYSSEEFQVTSENVCNLLSAANFFQVGTFSIPMVPGFLSNLGKTWHTRSVGAVFIMYRCGTYV